VRDGILANWGKGVVGKYLACDYATGQSASTNVLTVLFPHSAEHPKAEFSRQGSSVVIVRQEDIDDCAFESSGESLVKITPEISARARAGIIRLKAGFGLVSLWLMDAVRFVSDGFEFESTAPVVLFRKAPQVHVSAQVRCRVAFGKKDLAGIVVDGEQVHGFHAMLEPGSHVLTLVIRP
jgi:hypothetical protein